MNHFNLSADQENAADKFIEFILNDEKEFVLKGGPGVGKSYLTKYFLHVMKSDKKILNLLTNGKFDKKAVLTATTNKAAKVLGDFTFEDAQTIHSYLGLRVVNNFSTGKTTLQKTKDYQVAENVVIFIDEASMVDQYLLDTIRESTMNCKVVFIGDGDQLAPVFETSCPVFNIPNQVELTQVHRQAADSSIITLGRAFRDTVSTSQFPTIVADGKDIIHANDTLFQSMIDDEFSKESTTAKIVTWTNNRVHQYNAYIREMLGYPVEITPGEVLIANAPVMSGQRVICKIDDTVTIQGTRVDTKYDIEGVWLNIGGVEVFKADEQFRVKQILKQLSKAKEWQQYFTLKDFFVDLRPVHASTIHKSQGSTYTKVFIDLADIGTCNKPNEVARLLHVAITRAEKQVVFHGHLPTKYGG